MSQKPNNTPKELRPVDLHVHSNRSDGSMEPYELVDLAIQKNLAAFALTDHDTVSGIDEAILHATDANLEVIPGIELSTEYCQKDIHIVGLYIDHKSASFQSYLKEFQDSRDLRNRKMCQKLTDHGADITYEELCAEFPGSVITRAHYARLLLKKGYVKSLPEAFDRYIGDHAPCFLPREKITPQQGIDLIVKSGGFPILAHPVLYRMSDARLEELVSSLKDGGLRGIETVYSTYHLGEERQMTALAQKYDLLPSGGSDFHGKAKPDIDLGTGRGRLFVPYEFLQNIKLSL